MNERSRTLDNSSKQEGKRQLNHSRVMYLGYYLAIGSLMPYINLYFERMGFNGVQIGSLAALAVLAGSVSSLFLGGIADALTWHNRILSTALFLSPIAVFLISNANSFQALIIILVLYAFFNSPVIPILDSSALQVAKNYHGSYGNLRLWGTIGWSISSLLVGTLIENLDIRWIFYGYITFMSFTFIMSLRHSTNISSIKSHVYQELHHLFRPHFFIFLLSIFLVSMTSGGFLSFFSIYLDGINTKESMIGLAWTLASLSEIPIMLGAVLVIRKIGSSGLLKISFLTYALRWLLLSLISIPWLALLTQLLHGLSFATFLVGSVTYINELAPKKLSTTAQAIFNAVSFGFANIIGSLLGGYFHDTLGMSIMFRFFSLIAICGLFVFFLSDKFLKKSKLQAIQT